MKTRYQNLEVMKISMICLCALYSLLSYTQTPSFMVQYGHRDQVNDVVFMRDGTLLVSAGEDKIINLWDLRSGANIQTFSEFSTPIHKISLSEGDSLLAINMVETIEGKWDYTYINKLALLNFNRKEITFPFTMPDSMNKTPIWDFSFLNENEFLMAWTYSHIFIWNVKNGMLQKIINLEEEEIPVGFISSTKEFLIRNSEDGIFSTFRMLESYPNKKELNLKPSYLHCYPRIHPNEKFVLYSEDSGRIVLSDLETGKEIREFSFFDDKEKHKNFEHFFSPDGSYLATVSYTFPPFKFDPFDIFSPKEYLRFTDVVISEISSGEVVHRFEQVENTITKVCFLQNRNCAILYGGDSYLPLLNMWDWKNKTLLTKLNGKVGRVDVLEKNENESMIAFGDLDFKTLRLLDMKSLTITPLEDKRLYSQDIYNNNVNNVGASALAFDSSGNKMISSNWDNKVFVWDLDKHVLKEILTSPDSNEIINNLCFGHDDNHIITAGMFGEEKHISILDMMDQVEHWDSIYSMEAWLNKEKENMYDIRLTDKDKLVKLKYWDLQKKESIGFKGVHKSMYSLKYLPFKNQFATIEYDNGVATAAWWDLNSGEQVDFIPMDYLDTKYRNFAINENGNLFARGSEAGNLEVYEDNGYKTEFKIDVPINAVVFSESSKYIAAGLEGSNEIAIWDIYENKKISTLNGHWNTIQHLSFLENDSLLVSCSIDGNMIFWDWRKEELLFYCLSLRDNNESVIISKDNYYKSSKNGIKALVAFDGNRTFSFEQFDLRLNRPDKVLSLVPDASPEIINAYKKAYEKRLEKLDFTEEMLSEDFHTPDIEVSTDDISSLTTNNRLEVKVKAHDEKVKLDRINAWVNDVPIHGRNGIDLRAENTNNWEGEIIVNLSRGSNKIQVSALNQGAAESIKETVYITYQAPDKKPDLYLVCIGVTEHRDTLYNLEFAAKDALDISKVFGSENKIYNNVYVKTFIEKEVEHTSIRMAKEFLNQSEVDDVVIVFYAGHGLRDANYNLYLSSYNTDFNHPEQNSIPYETIEGLLDGIPARQKILFIDACLSGEIDVGNLKKSKKKEQLVKKLRWRTNSRDSALVYKNIGLKNAFELMKDLFVDLRRGTGAIVVSSSGGIEMAWESSKFQNGIFTYTLKEGLTKMMADDNRDGQIFASELQKYLRKKVPEVTNGRQRPTTREYNLSNDFRIW